MDEEQTKTVTFNNARFGELTIDRKDCLEFPNGIPGFERFKGFGIVHVEEESPFLRLLSLDEANLGFVILNPLLIWPDYDPNISKEELGTLQIDCADQLAIYCIVTLSEDPNKVTANLQGPIYINTDKMMARQMIVVDDRYHTKHAVIS